MLGALCGRRVEADGVIETQKLARSRLLIVLDTQNGEVHAGRVLCRLPFLEVAS